MRGSPLEVIMSERLDAFEHLISELHRTGITMRDFDYGLFQISLDQLDSTLFRIAEKTGHASFLPDYARYRYATEKDGLTCLSLYFPGLER